MLGCGPLSEPTVPTNKVMRCPCAPMYVHAHSTRIVLHNFKSIIEPECTSIMLDTISFLILGRPGPALEGTDACPSTHPTNIGNEEVIYMSTVAASKRQRHEKWESSKQIKISKSFSPSALSLALWVYAHYPYPPLWLSCSFLVSPKNSVVSLLTASLVSAVILEMYYTFLPRWKNT